MMFTEDMCLQAQAVIAGRLGLNFTNGRQGDLERGLGRALRTASLSDPEAYVSWLATLPEENPEWKRLAGYLTVGETYFFRDGACFDALERHVLPELIAARRSEGTLRLRLWSAACATGEEAYSLAIMLDRLLPDRSDWALTLLATDINVEALDAAQRGVFREWSFRGTPQRILEQYFHRRGAEAFEVAPKIRRMVTFAPLNLAQEVYPSLVTNTGAMDVILCRNVLMYFTCDAQRAAMARLQRALTTRGWLVVSPVEASAELLHPLAPVNFPGAVFYRKEETRPETGDQGPPIEAVDPWPQTFDSWYPTAVGVSSGPISSPSEEQAAPHENPLPAQAPELPVQTILQRARALADQGKLDDAQRLCEAALVEDRLNLEAHILMGAIYQEKGEVPAALEALRRAIYLDPHSAPAHFLLGSLLLHQGKHGRGRRCMETATRLLNVVPSNETVAGSDGLTAGRLLEMAKVYLESAR